MLDIEFWDDFSVFRFIVNVSAVLLLIYVPSVDTRGQRVYSHSNIKTQANLRYSTQDQIVSINNSKINVVNHMETHSH